MGGSAALALSLVACAEDGGGGEAEAGAFPSGDIEFILPSSPGGSTDLIGRAIGRAMAEPLGVNLTPVNAPGANGTVGGRQALNANPDGYTIVMLFQSLMAITPKAVDDLDAIEFDEMDVLGGLTVEDYVLVINGNESDFDTLDELLATPDLSYGTAGIGTGGQLSQALLLSESGVAYRDVPQDGGGPAVTALLGGQVDAITVQVAEAMPHIEEGTFVPLVTFNEERIEFLPDVPSARELGYDIVVDQKRFLATAKGLPEEVRQAYSEALEAAYQSDEYGDFLESNYISRWEVDADEVVTTIGEAEQRFQDQLDEHGVSLGS
jgi:tripartite-type tricarboxylate transporter receptor subunit TctC